MSEMDKGAEFLARGFAVQAKMMRIGGWVMIVLGVPLLLLFGIGVVPIVIGYICLRMAKKIERRETVEDGMDGIAAVGASLARRAKKSNN